MQYPAKAALESKYIDEVWVATDSRAISNVVLDLGHQGKLYVYKRSEESAQDNSNSEDVLLEFTSKYHKHGFSGKNFDLMVFMQCTSPLTTTEDIDGGIELLESCDDIDSVISGCEDHGGWLCGGFTWEEEIRMSQFEGAPRKTAVRITPYSHQRQNAPKRYRENGAFYITSRQNLRKDKSRLSGNIKFYEMPKSRSFEVDTQEDLNLLRSLSPRAELQTAPELDDYIVGL